MPNLDKNSSSSLNSAQNLTPLQTEFNPYQATLSTPSASSSQENNLIHCNHLTYGLYAVSFFTAGLTWIIPIVMNYIKRGEARGTWLESHFDWQIKTFWYGLFFGTIAVILLVMGFGGAFFGTMANSNAVASGSGLMMLLGFLIGGATILWHIYRLVRGWIALANRQAI